MPLFLLGTNIILYSYKLSQNSHGIVFYYSINYKYHWPIVKYDSNLHISILLEQITTKTVIFSAIDIIFKFIFLSWLNMFVYFFIINDSFKYLPFSIAFNIRSLLDSFNIEQILFYFFEGDSWLMTSLRVETTDLNGVIVTRFKLQVKILRSYCIL